MSARTSGCKTRTPQRNRKQRTTWRSNTNQNNHEQQPNNNQNNNDGGGGQLGTVLPGQPGPLSNCLGNCQEAFEGCAEPFSEQFRFFCLGFCSKTDWTAVTLTAPDRVTSRGGRSGPRAASTRRVPRLHARDQDVM